MSVRRGTTARAVAALLLVGGMAGSLAAPCAARAQIAEEVERMEDGRVRFRYATRPGVEICEQGLRMGDQQIRWRMRGDDVSARDCRQGPVEVELDVRDGRVRDVEVVTDRSARSRGAVDLGEVTPGQAAGYLLSLAYGGATADGAEESIFPAMIADVDGAWRELLAIARDRSVHGGVRKSALFWLGQEAADAVTEGIATVATDETEDREIRNSAIFALSQRDDEEAVPVLIELARTADQPETRRSAMFWLAQSEDPRVVQFFEDVLTGRNQRE